MKYNNSIKIINNQLSPNNQMKLLNQWSMMPLNLFWIIRNPSHSLVGNCKMTHNLSNTSAIGCDNIDSKR